eukprot:4904908-Pleurochrysis_carterae.AAC.2
MSAAVRSPVSVLAERSMVVVEGLRTMVMSLLHALSSSLKRLSQGRPTCNSMPEIFCNCLWH